MTTTPTLESLVTKAEVAARLRLSPRQIDKLRAAGRLPVPLRLGRSIRWRESDISAFIERGCMVRA